MSYQIHRNLISDLSEYLFCQMLAYLFFILRFLTQENTSQDLALEWLITSLSSDQYAIIANTQNQIETKLNSAAVQRISSNAVASIHLLTHFIICTTTGYNTVHYLFYFDQFIHFHEACSMGIISRGKKKSRISEGCFSYLQNDVLKCQLQAHPEC